MQYVALWRGINVGRAKRLAMADLRSVLASLGATRVHTLLNSGNAVFDCSEALAPETLRAAVLSQLGVDAPVIVKTAAEWTAVAADPGLANAHDPSRLLVAVTRDAQALAQLQAAMPQNHPDCRWTPHAGYLWCPDGVLATPLATRWLQPGGERVTTRNWATVLKIAVLLDSR